MIRAMDYYPFGLEMPGRSYNSSQSVIGFNGKRKDKDGEFGSLTHYDYGFRIYNPAIAKFLSVDPLTEKYPFYTPYQFAGNKPIWAVDLDGLEDAIYTIVEDLNGNKKESLIELERMGKAGPGTLTLHYGYHGNLDDPKGSLEETLNRMQLLSSTFMPTLFISGGEAEFDSFLDLDVSVEVGPNMTARGRILGFGGGTEIGVTGEVAKLGLQGSAQLDEIRINPNTGIQDPNVKFSIGGDAAIFSGTASMVFGFEDFAPEVKDVEFEGGVSVLKVKTQATNHAPMGKIELASGAIGFGLLKIKASLSTPSFDMSKGGAPKKDFNLQELYQVPADNVRVGVGNGF